MSTDTTPTDVTDNVRWFAEIGLDDLEVVGGKNSSLGEMISNLADAGVSVPDGFATTAVSMGTASAQSTSSLPANNTQASDTTL